MWSFVYYLINLQIIYEVLRHLKQLYMKTFNVNMCVFVQRFKEDDT